MDCGKNALRSLRIVTLLFTVGNVSKMNVNAHQIGGGRNVKPPISSHVPPQRVNSHMGVVIKKQMNVVVKVKISLVQIANLLAIVRMMQIIMVHRVV